jgi:hypothetical protein
MMRLNGEGGDGWSGTRRGRCWYGRLHLIIYICRDAFSFGSVLLVGGLDLMSNFVGRPCKSGYDHLCLVLVGFG